MNDMNYVAILVAAVAIMVVSTVYYVIFTAQLAQLNPAYAEQSARPQAGKLLIELVRNLILATVMAWLASELDIGGAGGGLGLGLALWIGFPVVLWTGSVLWEKYSPKLATIHAGDWLLKMLVIGIIVSVWQQRSRSWQTQLSAKGFGR